MPSDPHSFQAVGWIVVALAGLLVIARNTVGFWREITRPTGQDAIAHASAQFQPRGDYVTRSELEGKLGGITQELHALRRELRDLEDRQVEASDERIRGVHERIDGLPSQIIAQLSNLGVLVRPNLDRHPV
ncbi:MAG: hypothetical protein U1G08_17850 [Verrucomicrobiota bacterium]